jgi:predicted transcriptional regulator
MSKLHFACKQIDFADLVRCSFNLNKTEYSLFMHLIEQNEAYCAATIGEEMGKDRTTIQKAVKKLVEKGLVLKRQMNLETGGYTYVYKIKDKETIRETILSIVNSWHKNVVGTIKSW